MVVATISGLIVVVALRLERQNARQARHARRAKTQPEEDNVIDVRHEYMKALRAIPDTVRVLLDGVDDETARCRPEDGEWALVEIVAHMADVDERARARIERMISEDDPHLEPFDQDQLAVESRYIERPLDGEADRLGRTRRATLELLRSLDDGWQKTGRHGEHGRVTVENYVAHCAAEDVDHLAQIARTRTTVIAT